MNKFFKINSKCAFILVMSMISGFPSNSKYTRDLYLKGEINELEGELRERSFLRSHRSFIINILFIMNFSLYAKNSYLVSFENIEEKAMITKENIEILQRNYF